MRSRKRYFWVLLAAFLCPLLSYSQDFQPKFSVGVKYMGLTTHLKKSLHPQIYKRKFDKGGHVVINHGLILNFEYFVSDRAAIRLSQALVPFDCANKFLGATQLGISYGRFIAQSSNEIRIVAGPIHFYRRSWKDIDGYKDDGLFRLSKNGKWQTKFVWYGGEIEYNYWLNQNQAFSLNWLPGVPELFTFSPGYKMWY